MNIEISPEQSAELTGDLTPAEEAAAMKLGFAMALSEAGITPSQAENFLKTGAQGAVSNVVKLPFNMLSSAAKGIPLWALLASTLGGVAVGTGAYQLKDMLSGGDEDPEVRKLRAKLNKVQDLRAARSLTA